MYGRKITPTQAARGHAAAPLPARARTAASSTCEALAAEQEVILCEALIDALTFWCAGFRNVTASYGVEGFTADHLEAFKRHGTERVLIAYDRDEAGDRAAAALAEKLMAEGIDVLPGPVSAGAWTPTSTRCKVTAGREEPGRARPERGVDRQGQDAEPRSYCGAPRSSAVETEALRPSDVARRAARQRLRRRRARRPLQRF